MKYLSSAAAGLLAAMLLVGCQHGPSSDPGQPVGLNGAEVSVSAASASQAEPEIVTGTVEVNASAQELIALSETGEWSWFDDAVMIGDSVSLKLKNFVVKQRQSDPDYFGGGQFLTSGSLGSGNALWDVDDKSVHPSFQGEKMRLEESVPLTGAKKVYLMLGINDIAVYGLEGAVENYQTLLDNIQAAAPGVQFFIQSATPICNGAEKGALTNVNLEQYNALLRDMCTQRGIAFVDVASVLRDADGFLPREYCSDPDDMGIHLTDVACQLWLGYLLEDAAQRTPECGLP